MENRAINDKFINLPEALKSLDRALEGFNGQFLFFGETNHESPKMRGFIFDNDVQTLLIGKHGFEALVYENVGIDGKADGVSQIHRKTLAAIDERLDMTVARDLMNPLIFFWILSDQTSTVLSKIIGWGLNHHGNNGPHIGMVWRYLHVLEQRI